MRRTSLQRSTPLRSKAPPKRRTPVRRVNRKRAAKRKAECFGEQARLCRVLPCVTCEPEYWRFAFNLGNLRRCAEALGDGVAMVEQSEPHHIPSRGAGGRDCDCVPLCKACHLEFHVIGERSFCEGYGIDLRAIAKRIHEVLQS